MQIEKCKMQDDDLFTGSHLRLGMAISYLCNLQFAILNLHSSFLILPFLPRRILPARLKSPG